MSSTNDQQLAQSDDDIDVKEQDRFLPIANVARIMKKALPDNAKISKEAKETVQECVSEFISFITSEASDRCQNEKRKTINGEDILTAMHMLGFENYSEALKLYLAKYRDVSKPEKDGEQSNKEEQNAGVHEAQNNAVAAAAAAAAVMAAAQANQQGGGGGNPGMQDPNLAMYMNQAANPGNYY
ncbi:Nuclear transcription factor Y subunit B-3 [Smittium mucronatum]|uniref:Nuclear transcription factor Y subunit B-3 n=1 Tax=Smittium mucronatum TaxID=133383 RepID=A0A1R0H2W4_9FUNG|nr:Nuclear transcription factor Y subunit B-3 [Smittium mucronatum]